MFIFTFLSFYQELEFTFSLLQRSTDSLTFKSEFWEFETFSDGSDEKSCEKVDIPGKTKNPQ